MTTFRTLPVLLVFTSFLSAQRGRVPVHLYLAGDSTMAAMLRAQLIRLPGILASLNSAKKFFSRNVESSEKVRVAKCHDIDGDCGVQTLLTADTEATMRSLSEKLKGKVSAFSPIDTGRHVYSN